MSAELENPPSGHLYAPPSPTDKKEEIGISLERQIQLIGRQQAEIVTLNKELKELREIKPIFERFKVDYKDLFESHTHLQTAFQNANARCVRLNDDKMELKKQMEALKSRAEKEEFKYARECEELKSFRRFEKERIEKRNAKKEKRHKKEVEILELQIAAKKDLIENMNETFDISRELNLGRIRSLENQMDLLQTGFEASQKTRCVSPFFCF